MPLPHHSLVAWQRADALFFRVHSLSRTFPPEERYELGSQLRRSAFSVPVNIVEAFGRYGGKERLHFLQIASSSLAEVGYCVDVARRLGYMDQKTYEELELEVRKVSSPLRGLIRNQRTAKEL